MANKYTQWCCMDFYNNKAALADEYTSLLKMPFFYNSACNLKIATYFKHSEKVFTNKMGYMEMLIVGILAAGYNMTLSQLKAYLLLKSENVSNSQLKCKLENMIQWGIIERNVIYDSENLNKITTDRMLRRIVSYGLTHPGYIIAKALGAPSYTVKKYRLLINNHRGRISFLIKSILWNQIVLNQILYNPNCIRFKIEDVCIFSDWKNMELPFYLKTSNEEYYFEYVHALDEAAIHSILCLWEDYAKYRHRNFTFVLVADKYESAMFFSHHVEKVNNLGMNIATTVVGDWYKETTGTIMMALNHL